MCKFIYQWKLSRKCDCTKVQFQFTQVIKSLNWYLMLIVWRLKDKLLQDLHSFYFIRHLQLMYYKCRLTWWFLMFANCCIRWTTAHVHFLLPLDSNGNNIAVFDNILGNSSDTRRRAMTNPVNWKAHSLKTWFRFHNLCFARKKWEKDSLLW